MTDPELQQAFEWDLPDKNDLKPTSSNLTQKLQQKLYDQIIEKENLRFKRSDYREKFSRTASDAELLMEIRDSTIAGKKGF